MRPQLIFETSPKIHWLKPLIDSHASSSDMAKFKILPVWSAAFYSWKSNLYRLGKIQIVKYLQHVELGLGMGWFSPHVSLTEGSCSSLSCSVRAQRSLPTPPPHPASNPNHHTNWTAPPLITNILRNTVFLTVIVHTDMSELSLPVDMMVPFVQRCRTFMLQWNNDSTPTEHETGRRNAQKLSVTTTFCTPITKCVLKNLSWDKEWFQDYTELWQTGVSYITSFLDSLTQNLTALFECWCYYYCMGGRYRRILSEWEDVICAAQQPKSAAARPPSSCYLKASELLPESSERSRENWSHALWGQEMKEGIIWNVSFRPAALRSQCRRTYYVSPTETSGGRNKRVHFLSDRLSSTQLFHSLSSDLSHGFFFPMVKKYECTACSLQWKSFKCWEQHSH